jgi:hypothetical protein
LQALSEVVFPVREESEMELRGSLSAWAFSLHEFKPSSAPAKRKAKRLYLKNKILLFIKAMRGKDKEIYHF